ncbi:MAG TPA: dihydrodipicolinate reductase C-terminal domain-containing protein [Gaiellaceae bacterium]
MRILLFGCEGKVGRVLGPALEAAGHEVVGIGRGDDPDPGGADAAVDFTAPDALRANAERCLAAGVPCVIGTTGLGEDDVAALDVLAREQGLPCVVAPNFAVGAVLMMRFAEEAARFLPRVEIVELHDEAKRDAPSGTAKATAARLGGDVPIHSVRLPGLVAHQEVLLGGPGQLLTIRHDTHSREAFVPGVLLALERLGTLPAGVTRGIEPLLAEPPPQE